MTKYRIKQTYDDEFYPQVKDFLWGWAYLSRTECNYGGCWSERIVFPTHEEASFYLEQRELAIAQRKAEKLRKKTLFPKYFPWP